tara:strand:- start:8253 stop:8918 length:666 start_codon:yes stop_codon:yes gene_type:complete
VIAVIGILFSVIIAGVGHIREFAQASRCSANLKQLHSATTLWIADHDYRMPDNRYWSYDGRPSSDSYDYQIAPYLGFEDMNMGMDLGNIESAMNCPASESEIPSTNEWKRTYSINNHATSTTEGADRSVQWYPRSIHQIAEPSRMALYMDGVISAGSDGAYWTNAQNSNVSSGGGGASISYPHGGSVNVVFVDGHVEKISQQEMVADFSEAYIPFWRYNAE